MIGSKAVWLIEEIPVREFLLARRVYVCYNQVVLARQAMRIRLVSFYWPAKLVIEKKNLLSERENKNLEIYNKTADIISGVTIFFLMLSYRYCTGNNDRAIFTY